MDPSPQAAAAEALRSTAKWLVTAFAAIGAVLIAGLQLTDIGELQSENWLYLVLALAGLLGALLAVGYMIRETVTILTVEWVTLADLADETFEKILYEGKDETIAAEKAELFALAERIKNVREELFAHTAPSIGKLHRHLHQANEAAAKVAGQERPQLSADDQAKIFGRARELRDATRAVVDYANYVRTLRLFTRLKKRLAGGGIAAAISIAVYAFATHPPTSAEPVRIEGRITSR